jgi:hypothetical protein
MFLVRSAFWLIAAYMVIKPAVDFDPNAAADRAMAAGQQVIAAQIDAIECDSLQCLGGKAVLAAALPETPSVGPTMQDSPTVKDVPYPMPRLRRAG